MTNLDKDPREEVNSTLNQLRFNCNNVFDLYLN